MGKITNRNVRIKLDDTLSYSTSVTMIWISFKDVYGEADKNNVWNWKPIGEDNRKASPRNAKAV